MASPIDAWHAEHLYFGRLLSLLHEQVDIFHTGEQPNYELMLDIVSYLRDYTDQVHHPREDMAFVRLAKYRPDLKLVLERLHQEHRVIAQAGETLRMLLQAIVRERSHRSLEGLLASTRPQEIIFGKLLGVGLLSILVLGAWLGVGAGVGMKPPVVPAGMNGFCGS